MVDGSVAQPVMANPYSAEKIPLSEAYAVSLFFHYGTKCVMDDLILYYATAAGVTVSSAAGTTTGKTALTVDPVSAGTGRSFVYKTAATVTMPKVGENLTSWTAWNGTDEITATTGNQIVVAIVDSTSRLCKMAGSATVAAKA
ncbi:hypothetical protein SDC9_103593 [bioreactor metagenome]|uniref:S-layer protein SbsC C-terminal domain-containing protein n=1 Tax=bioreactor metagenome TaxID=1076179 RepID=A0A645AVJ0_9ZZZZ